VCDLDEIEKELKSESDELRLRIVREIGQRFAVALLTKSGTGENMTLTLAGSGTLVMVGKSYYILTAAHVWEFLKKADAIGITITEDMDHAFFMDARTIAATVEIKADKWNEWGPDLAFLKIPAEYLGTIQAYKGFYSPDVDGRLVDLPKEVVEARLLLGVPAELGTYTRTHADFRIDGCYLDPTPKAVVKNEHDFVDLIVALKDETAPKSYGGMSGGGLWKILVHCSPSNDKVVWSQRLAGVAFYELTDDEGNRVIRCHASQSIENAFPTS